MIDFCILSLFNDFENRSSEDWNSEDSFINIIASKFYYEDKSQREFLLIRAFLLADIFTFISANP